MPTNWKSVAEKENAKTYVLPEGWDSRETVAEQLECSPEKVDDHLRPALRSGKVIKQQYRVWDAGTKRITMVVAYHDTSKDRKPEGDLKAQVEALRAQGKTWPEIGKALGGSAEKFRAMVRR